MSTIQSLSKKAIVLALLFVATFNATTLFAQVKIGSNPTVITPTSNLEVEGTVGGDISKMAVTKDSSKVGIGTAGPTNKLHVKSAANPVRLEGLLQGTGNESILSIDANGVVKRQPALIPVPTTRLTVGISAAYNYTSNGADRIVPFNTVQSSDGNFSNATHFYTVPTYGTYEISGVIFGNGYTTTGEISHALFVYINNSIKILMNNYTTGTFPNSIATQVSLAGSVTLRLAAGTTVGLLTTTCLGCNGTSVYNMQSNFTNMTIVKID